MAPLTAPAATAPEAGGVHQPGGRPTGTAPGHGGEGRPAADGCADQHSLDDRGGVAALLVGGQPADDPTHDHAEGDDADRQRCAEGTERDDVQHYREDRDDDERDDGQGGQKDGPEASAGGIGERERVVAAVGVGSPRERVVDVLDDGVRADEQPVAGRVPASSQVEQARDLVGFTAGEAVGQRSAGAGALQHRAVRVVAQALDQRAGHVACPRQAAEVVGVQEQGRPGRQASGGNAGAVVHVQDELAVLDGVQRVRADPLVTA
jgi:hypothetical protein